MIKNYFTIALRNLQRYKAYSFINIAGLAVGIACCMLILLYIQDEMSFDAFHTKADHIYRIKEDIDLKGGEEHSVRTPFPVASQLAQDFPQVKAVRIFKFDGPVLTILNEKHFQEENVFVVDSTFFDVFSFPLIAGDPLTALKKPNSILLTEETSRKYFGSESGLGKVLKMGPIGFQQDYKVTGILRNVPRNSHMHFDFLMSFSTLNQIFNNALTRQWFWNPCWTYVLLPEGYTSERMNAQLTGFVHNHFPPDLRNNIQLSLQPLTSIHLHSQRELEMETNSNVLYIYIFSAVAFFILLIACINFMNLSTARSAKRAKEVGLRKVVGAYRSQLIGQFFGESFFISFLSLGIAIFIISLMLPAFNSFTEKQLSLTTLLHPAMVSSIIGIGLFVAVVAGSYPALFLSAFAPLTVLRSNASGSGKRFFIRRVLVVGQFSASIIMLISTGIVYQQMQHISNRQLGFAKDHILLLNGNNELGRQYKAFKEALVRQPGVLGMTAMTERIGTGAQIRQFDVEGIAQSHPVAIASLGVDGDFVKTMHLTMVQGREFSSDFTADTAGAVIINEAAMRYFGWNNPLGKRIMISNNFPPPSHPEVIGVVKDFNFASLHQKIEPLVLFPGGFRFLAVRIMSTNIPATIERIEGVWKQYAPQEPMEYHFLDTDIDQLYRAERKLGIIVGFFSIFAIFVACLGLFGLAAFTAEQRRKEIGMRKVLGASVGQIVLLLSKDFTVLVFVALLIACPVAYLAMNRWLQEFAYRIDISAEIFLLAGFLSLMVAWLTVSYQSVKAALSNPVQSLRYE